MYQSVKKFSHPEQALCRISKKIPNMGLTSWRVARILGDMTTTYTTEIIAPPACTGRHFGRRLPSEGPEVWLMLCDACTEATLVIGALAVGTYTTAEEAEAAYITRITEGAI